MAHLPLTFNLPPQVTAAMEKHPRPPTFPCLVLDCAHRAEPGCTAVTARREYMIRAIRGGTCPACWSALQRFKLLACMTCHTRIGEAVTLGAGLHTCTGCGLKWGLKQADGGDVEVLLHACQPEPASARH